MRWISDTRRCLTMPSTINSILKIAEEEISIKSFHWSTLVLRIHTAFLSPCVDSFNPLTGSKVRQFTVRRPCERRGGGGHVEAEPLNGWWIPEEDAVRTLTCFITSPSWSDSNNHLLPVAYHVTSLLWFKRTFLTAPPTNKAETWLTEAAERRTATRGVLNLKPGFNSSADLVTIRVFVTTE